MLWMLKYSCVLYLLLICAVICGVSVGEICFSLQVKIQSKFSSTSFKEPTKIPGSVVEIVKSVMIYIFILTTTLFVLHAIKTPYYFKSCLW